MNLPQGKACKARGFIPAGFSLLELMIVLAVASILLAVAIPSYQRYVQRAHRAEAVRLILAIADCQERIRASKGFYDTSQCLASLDSESHDFRIEPAGEADSLTFTIVAEPREAWADHCGSLSLDQSGTRAISGDPGELLKCWGGR